MLPIRMSLVIVLAGAHVFIGAAQKKAAERFEIYPEGVALRPLADIINSLNEYQHYFEQDVRFYDNSFEGWKSWIKNQYPQGRDDLRADVLWEHAQERMIDVVYKGGQLLAQYWRRKYQDEADALKGIRKRLELVEKEADKWQEKYHNLKNKAQDKVEELQKQTEPQISNNGSSIIYR